MPGLTGKELKKEVKNLNRFIDSAVESQERRLARVMKNLEEKLVDLSGRLSVSPSGAVKGPASTFRQVERIKEEMDKIFVEYYDLPVKKITQDYKVINKKLNAYYKKIGLGAGDGILTSVDKIMLTSLRKQSFKIFKDLGLQTQNKVAQSFYDTIVSGDSFSKLVSRIRASVRGYEGIRGTPMEVYAKTFAQDGLMNYYQSIHNTIAKKIGLQYYLYSGTEIATSREFCLERVGNVYSKEEIDSWNDLEWAGKSGNVWQSVGGYNCRHFLLPVKKDWTEDVEA